ncbi:MAG: hypothetical protein EG824_01140 [Deltaproteobacteria bacterium]|nr:hypothetical protein [Deltaproteobacteria bacterium]
MQSVCRLIVLMVALYSASAIGGKIIEVRTDLEDVFLISETDQWNVKVERELTLRFADVRVEDKRGYPFSLMLYFKADTPDLAQFDTPEKIERSVRSSSEKYLSGAVEKKITIHKVPVSGTYGFYTVLTDADIANKPNPKPREFKFLTRGMVRLSKNSVLGFSLMTSDTESDNYRRLLDFVYRFVKSGANG